MNAMFKVLKPGKARERSRQGTSAAGMMLILAALALLAAPLLIAGCGGLPDEAAASVNGIIISKDDVAARIDYRSKIFPGMVSGEDEENFPKIRRQTAKDLVWLELERQEADRRGISVSNDEVSAGMTLMAEDEFLGDVQRMMEYYAEQGVTQDELAQNTYERLLHEKMSAAVSSEVSVSEYDIQSYYQKNSKQYNQSELRQTRMIETDSEPAALQAAGRISAGESFTEVAKQVSVDPLADENGGNLGLVAKGQLSPELDAVLFGMSMGQVSDPVRVAERWYVIRLEGITPGRNVTLEEAREEIRVAVATELSAAKWQSLMDGLFASASLQYHPDYDPAGS